MMRLKTKLKIIVLAVFLIFSSGYLTIYGQQTVISAVPSLSNIKVGETVSVAVNITGAIDVYSCQISLSYDPNVLQYQSVQEGTFLNQNGAATTLTINPLLEAGKIFGYAVSRAGSVPGLNGNGTLATFRFNAIGAGTSAIGIITGAETYKGTRLINSSVQEIAYSKQDSQIAVTAATVSQPNIILSKQADKTLAQAGDILAYAINYQNVGTAEAKEVIITDPIPAGTSYVTGSATNNGFLSGSQIQWNIGSVTAGASGSVSFQVKVQ